MATLNICSEIPVDKETREEISGGGGSLDKKRKSGEKIFITEEDEEERRNQNQLINSSSISTNSISTEGGGCNGGREGDGDVDVDIDTGDGSTLSCVRKGDDDVKKVKGQDSDGVVEVEEERLNLELTKAFDDLSVTTTGSEDDQNVPNPDSKGDLTEKLLTTLGANSLNTSMTSDDEGLDGGINSVWKGQQRHVFILSESGKPIFSRHGNEEKLVTLFGVMQALVSFVQDSDDSIRSIRIGDTIVVFLLKAPLILVCASSMGESVAQIQTQLMYLYNQIVSVLTSKQLLQIFEKRRNYDLRRLLSGSERLLYNLCNLVESDPSFILGAVRCLPLASSVRDTISQTISQTLSKLKQDVVFAILLANNQLVSLVRMKKCFMHPMDLHVIVNFIDSSESFKTAETWSPLCLPRFDSTGFVHAHVSYLSDECQACLVLLTVDRESFFALSEAKQKIVDRLKRHNCLEAINASMRNDWPTMSFVNVPEVRHFLYKNRSIAQFMSPALEAPYVGSSSSILNSSSLPANEDTLHNLSISSISSQSGGSGAPHYLPPDMSEELQRLYSKYYRIHSRLHSQSRPVKLVYWVDDTENWLGWLTSTFELYVTFEPLVKKSTAITAINKLLKWVKKEEDRIFIMNSPTF